MNIFCPLMAKVPSPRSLAEVDTSFNELPAWGSVKHIVPVHFPESILGTNLSANSFEPKDAIKCAAPCERPVNITTELCAAPRMNSCAPPTKDGSCWPPCSKSKVTPIIPDSPISFTYGSTPGCTCTTPSTNSAAFLSEST